MTVGMGLGAMTREEFDKIGPLGGRQISDGEKSAIRAHEFLWGPRTEPFAAMSGPARTEPRLE